MDSTSPPGSPDPRPTQHADRHPDPAALLERVRKLLAKAEDPATTPEESETYTAKAAALIAQYGIDEALLAADDPGRDPVGDLVVHLEAPYATDKADLLATVAHHLRCRAVRRRERDGAGGMRTSLHLFGHRSDLVRSELLFTSLLLQATTQVARTLPPRDEHLAAWRRSWLAGFRGAVDRRLAAAEAAAAAQAAQDAATGGSTASPGTSGRAVGLVLADRAVAVDDAVTAAYPDARQARQRRLSGSGAVLGWAAGQRADLGDGAGLDGSGRRALPRQR